jgi:hypothetical protein
MNWRGVSAASQTNELRPNSGCTVAAAEIQPHTKKRTRHSGSYNRTSRLLIERVLSVPSPLLPSRVTRLPFPARVQRGSSDSSTSSRGSRQIVLYCAHRATTIHLNDPSKLACFPSLGRAPMLVYVRPSNEALLRARVPGAQDQRGCPSILLIVGALRARRTVCLLRSISEAARCASTKGSLVALLSFLCSPRSWLSEPRLVFRVTIL